MTADRLCLHSYWRSSAAYRVRIGLNLKGLPYDIAPVHLVRDGGEQHRPEYVQINPQQLVPVLQHGQRDRKSVVKGKSVSVRVELGGRRTMYKKKRNKDNR